MLKKFMAVGLCVIFLSVSAAAFAEDVYVTQNGSKYHKEICRFTKNKSAEKISKNVALERNLEPCGRCFKEDLSLLDEAVKTQGKVTKKK